MSSTNTSMGVIGGAASESVSLNGSSGCECNGASTEYASTEYASSRSSWSADPALVGGVVSGDRAVDARVPAVMGVGERGVFCAPGCGCEWEVTIHDIGGGGAGGMGFVRSFGGAVRGDGGCERVRLRLQASSGPASEGTSATCICIANVPEMAGVGGR